jgi:hypothetical protein
LGINLIIFYKIIRKITWNTPDMSKYELAEQYSMALLLPLYHEKFAQKFLAIRPSPKGMALPDAWRKKTAPRAQDEQRLRVNPEQASPAKAG